MTLRKQTVSDSILGVHMSQGGTHKWEDSLRPTLPNTDRHCFGDIHINMMSLTLKLGGATLHITS